MFTIKAQLEAKEHDLLGYTVYVFKNLDPNVPFTHKYIMCVRPPNWESKNIELKDIGFLTYKKVQAGIDNWYDFSENRFIPYRYTNIYFIKFVLQQDNCNKDIII